MVGGLWPIREQSGGFRMSHMIDRRCPCCNKLLFKEADSNGGPRRTIEIKCETCKSIVKVDQTAVIVKLGKKGRVYRPE